MIIHTVRPPIGSPKDIRVRPKSCRSLPYMGLSIDAKWRAFLLVFINIFFCNRRVSYLSILDVVCWYENKKCSEDPHTTPPTPCVDFLQFVLFCVLGAMCRHNITHVHTAHTHKSSSGVVMVASHVLGSTPDLLSLRGARVTELHSTFTRQKKNVKIRIMFHGRAFFRAELMNWIV